MRAHFGAFKALLLAVTILANKIYANVRMQSGAPVRSNYVVLYPDAPAALDDHRYTGRQAVESRSRWRYDVRVVAVDADGLLLLADAVMSIVGSIPQVEGRRCEEVSLVPGVEEGRGQYDRAADLHYMDLSFEFWSRRA